MMLIEQDIYEKVKGYTGVDYKGSFKEDGWCGTEEPNYMVSNDSTICMLEDLIWEIEHWKEKYEDLKEDVESNYEHKKIDPYDYYGISRNAFIDKTIL